MARPYLTPHEGASRRSRDDFRLEASTSLANPLSPRMRSCSESQLTLTHRRRTCNTYESFREFRGGLRGLDKRVSRYLQIDLVCLVFYLLYYLFISRLEFTRIFFVSSKRGKNGPNSAFYQATLLLHWERVHLAHARDETCFRFLSARCALRQT